MTSVCVPLRQWQMILSLLEHIKTQLHSVSSALLPSKLEWWARLLCSSHVLLQQIPFNLLTPICVIFQRLARRRENGIPACVLQADSPLADLAVWFALPQVWLTLLKFSSWNSLTKLSHDPSLWNWLSQCCLLPLLIFGDWCSLVLLTDSHDFSY